jgi:thiol-disulfide isomerase/thioredoxin
MSTTQRLVIVTLIGALAGSLAAFWYIRRAPAPAVASPTAASTPAPGTPAAGQTKRAKEVPNDLPDFTLATLEGPPKALSSFKQPVLVVNFWATWCAPCRREIPLLRQIRAERGSKGIEVVGIAVDFREDVQKYAAKIGLDYPLLIGEEDGLAAADKFGVDAVFPFTAFADAQRRIVALKVGELHAEEASFILDRVEKLNAGGLSIEVARQQIGDELTRLAAVRGK